MKPTPIPPQPGQESVWDYPRPACLEDVSQPIRVISQGIVLAETNRGKRVLETSHPPTYYIPSEDIKLECLIPTPRKTWCEWKGRCQYYDAIVEGKHLNCAAWRYIEPTSPFLAIQDYYGFYASVMDACYLGEEHVKARPGGYYGGWITKNIVGPFKGGAGTMGW